MDLREKDTHAIRAMKEGEPLYLRTFQEGGVLIHFVEGYYFLFEIPIYGGVPVFEKAFRPDQINDMIDIYETWT